jgi:hypothetical protein
VWSMVAVAGRTALLPGITERLEAGIRATPRSIVNWDIARVRNLEVEARAAGEWRI